MNKNLIIDKLGDSHKASQAQRKLNWLTLQKDINQLFDIDYFNNTIAPAEKIKLDTIMKLDKHTSVFLQATYQRHT